MRGWRVFPNIFILFDFIFYDNNPDWILLANASPTRVMHPTTSALPIKNALLVSDTPSSLVWLSGNISKRSNSTGVSLRYLPLSVTTTCLNLEGPDPPSPVIIVLDGASRLSGNVTGPSL